MPRVDASSVRTLALMLLCTFPVVLWVSPARADSGDAEWQPNDWEREMLALINEAREDEGLGPVTLDATLSRVARAHARELIRLGYLAHVSPTTGSPGRRVRDAGLRFAFVGENIAGHRSVRQIHRALLKSATHRRNILHEDVQVVGLAYVKGGPYGAVVVQLFLAPLTGEAAGAEKPEDTGAPRSEDRSAANTRAGSG